MHCELLQQLVSELVLVRLVLGVFNGAVHIYLRTPLMKIFVTLNKCFYRVHFRRLAHTAVYRKAFVLHFVSVAFLRHVARGCHPFLDCCVAELPSTFLSNCVVASIYLPIHRHILVVMDLSCGV